MMEVNYYNKFENDDTQYCFNGSLLEFLLNKGVPIKSILYSQNLYFEHDLIKEHYYRTIATEKNILIKTSKISFIHRINTEVSVFNNFARPNEKYLTNVSKFNNSLNNLVKFGINNLKEKFITGETFGHPIIATYYQDEDRYEIWGNGCHRSITAIMFGFENILANVTYKKRDEEKYQKYLKVVKFYCDYNINKIYVNYCNNKNIIVEFKDNIENFYIDYYLHYDYDLREVKKLIDIDKQKLSNYLKIYNKILRKIFPVTKDDCLEKFINKKCNIDTINYYDILNKLKEIKI